MSKHFYSENEELNFAESLNKYEFLFKDIKLEPPTLEEALIELFRNGGLSEKDSKEIYIHLYKMCNNKVGKNLDLIREQNPRISKNDALVISSYTYEPQKMYEKFSPYRLLNTNLVAENRKSGIINIEKYLFLLLAALRGLTKTKKEYLFRCISCKVKLEKDPNNNKYIPYKQGNQKIFWPFTSTSDDEKLSENFLGNGTGTKYKIIGDNLWGYDITLFNVYGEKEILLEPERKYEITNVKEGNIIEITCKVVDNPQILEICEYIYKLVVSILFFIYQCPVKNINNIVEMCI